MTVSLKNEKKEQLACLIRKTINKKNYKNKKACPINRENSGCITRGQIQCFVLQRTGQNKQYGLQKKQITMKHMQSYFKNQLQN